MSQASIHDDALVAQFVQMKGDVLARCGNDTSKIESLANGDKPFRQLCLELSFVATQLEWSEATSQNGVIAPVNQAFIREWRDYESRLSGPLAGVFLADLGLKPVEGEKSTQDEVIDDWAKQKANDLNSLIQYLEDRANDAGDEEYQTFLDDGLSAWNDLTEKAGLELQGVFRRLDLAPLVLVPSHIANKYGPKEARSLYQKWADARKSFVFGAFHSSIAMARATLEQILRDGYGLNSTELPSAITQLTQDFPHFAEVHRIIVVAKYVLHAEEIVPKRMTEFEKARNEKIVDEALSNFEHEIASALQILRQLIEDAPAASQSGASKESGKGS